MIRFLLVVLFTLAPLSTWAASYATATLDGYSSGYVRSMPTAVVGNGTITAQAVVNVAGKPITMPASMRMAANAGRYALNVARLNPLNIGLALAAYVALNNIDIDPVTGTLQKTANGYDYTIIRGQWAYYSPCNATLPHCPAPGYCPAGGSNSYEQGGFYCINAPAPQYQPVTEQDISIINPAPMTDAAAQELARSPFGLPVDAPELQPVDEPLGAPYTAPDGQTVQDRARITPSPTATDPTRVGVDTYQQPLDAQGQPDPQQQPRDLEDPQADFCQSHPTSISCADMGTDSQAVPTASHTITMTPVDLGMGAGSCPAPLSVSFGGQSTSIDFGPVCEGATWMKPVFLLMAAVSAYFIFVGGLRT